MQAPEQVDRLLYVTYRVMVAEKALARHKEELEMLMWDCFECVKRSFVLIPKLQMHTYLLNKSIWL